MAVQSRREGDRGPPSRGNRLTAERLYVPGHILTGVTTLAEAVRTGSRDERDIADPMMRACHRNFEWAAPSAVLQIVRLWMVPLIFPTVKSLRG